MSAVVWVMSGIAVWHFTVFVPDRFYGGIIGAFLAALAGGLLVGCATSGFTVPTANPPGISHLLYSLAGACAGLCTSYAAGVRSERSGP
jgi:hypothetical protein